MTPGRRYSSWKLTNAHLGGGIAPVVARRNQIGDSVDAPVDMNVSLGPCYIRDFSVTAWRSWDEIAILVIGLAPRVISDGNVRVIGMTLPPKTGPS